MPDLAMWHWAAVVVAVAVVLVPRAWPMVRALLPSRTAVSVGPTDEELLRAYQVVASRLTRQIARDVWLALQPRGGGDDAPADQ